MNKIVIALGLPFKLVFKSTLCYVSFNILQKEVQLFIGYGYLSV